MQALKQQTHSSLIGAIFAIVFLINSASACREGFTGNNCERDIDECELRPHVCQNGASCTNTNGSYQCNCAPGWSGRNCTEDVDECEANPAVCHNGATCINTNGSYQCNCVHGWTGRNCTEDIDDCLNSACEAGSTCIDRPGHYFCACPPGKTGLMCQLDDGCYPNPCQKNASCDTSPIDGHATCTCRKGYTGDDCSIDEDECAFGSPCAHGGLCINTPGSYRCECPRGFTGSRCEIDINECDANPCMNEATCLDEKGGFKCICMQGFRGTRCEIDIDECASNPCQNGAVCKDLVYSFQCMCQAGFWGQRCEFSVNSSNNNNNNGLNQFPNTDCTFDGGDCMLGDGNPWAKCSQPFACWTAFKDGKCDQSCNTAECLYDGNDCAPPPGDSRHPSSHSPHSSSSSRSRSGVCDDGPSANCLKNYANGVCDQECNSAECGWDGADCEMPASITRNEIIAAPSTEAQGLLVIRVEPAIEIGSSTGSKFDVELARMLRAVSVVTKTILKIQNFRQVEEGRGTEIELIADNRKCHSSCYNSTELIAKFLSALRSRTKEFEQSMNSGALKMTDIRSQVTAEPVEPLQTNANSWIFVMMIAVGLVCFAIMAVSIGNKKKVKERAIVWFPEGFKPNISSRNRDRDRDHSERKPGRAASTLQALGGNFFRGIKRAERNISTHPNGHHSTNIDRCETATPNGGAIYHEPYEQYSEYGTTYNATDSQGFMVSPPMSEPMTPPQMPMNPLNIEGPHGLTPLMVASMGPPFYKEPLGLVAYGTTGEMNNGAADNNVTDLLHKGAQLNLANKVTGETALHLAARHGRVDAARSLIERCDSQDINAQDASGRTPLHAAIAADSLGVFECLVRNRFTDINAQTNDGTTPLILAARVGTYSMLEELILNDCEVTKSDANGKTALHWAAATNNVDAIRRLLAVRETNKDAQDLAEETPLFLAAREGARGAVEILLSHNANKDISDQMDRSPIEIARSRQHHDIVRLLEEHEPSTPRSITSLHHHSRQLSPFSQNADSNSNSNSSSAVASSPAAHHITHHSQHHTQLQQQQQQQPPPPSYHAHSQSLGGRKGNSGGTNVGNLSQHLSSHLIYV